MRFFLIASVITLLCARSNSSAQLVELWNEYQVNDQIRLRVSLESAVQMDSQLKDGSVKLPASLRPLMCVYRFDIVMQEDARTIARHRQLLFAAALERAFRVLGVATENNGNTILIVCSEGSEVKIMLIPVDGKSDPRFTAILRERENTDPLTLIQKAEFDAVDPNTGQPNVIVLNNDPRSDENYGKIIFRRQPSGEWTNESRATQK